MPPDTTLRKIDSEHPRMSIVAKVDFSDYETSVHKALDLVGAAQRLPHDGLILIKPNLTNGDPPPVTTHVEAARAVCTYCRKHTQAEVAFAEGSGSGQTIRAFEKNGYADAARELGIRLIDLNEQDDVELGRDDALHWKRMYLPQIALEAFIISLPILKDHSFTRTTIAMKNMFGLAPPRRYAGSWNKSKLHSPSTDASVVDLCLYKAPDLCVVDAAVALTGMHLSGRPKDLNVILAGLDPVAVDAVGSELLGHRPRRLRYLTLADGRLGSLSNIEIVKG